MKQRSIWVQVARTREEFDRDGCEFMLDHFDTLAEAKTKAQYLLTESYQLISEASEPYGYAQVLLNGRPVADYHGKHLTGGVR